MAYTTIDDPEKYFKPLKYVGNLLQHPVEGFNHQPDWLWFKNADTTNSHNLLDSTRGTDKTLEGTNNNNAEGDTTTRLDSFDADGFTVETDPSVNGNNNEIVTFSWAANGGSVTNVAESGDNPGFSRQTNTTFADRKQRGKYLEHPVSKGERTLFTRRVAHPSVTRTYPS